MKAPIDHQIEQLQLQLKQAEEDLRYHLREAGQSFRPSRLLTDALRDISESTELKNQAVHTGITLATSFVLHKIASSRKKKQLEAAREIRQTSSIWERLAEKAIAAGIDIAKTEFQRRQQMA